MTDTLGDGVDGQRADKDFAQGLGQPFDARFCQAKHVVLVQDNLDAHSAAALHAAF